MNNRQIADIAGLRGLLSGFGRGDALVFHVQRSGQMVYVTAAADW